MTASAMVPSTISVTLQSVFRCLFFMTLRVRGTAGTSTAGAGAGAGAAAGSAAAASAAAVENACVRNQQMLRARR
jgi:hypothetical protein